jgi:hypothetical protein
MLKFTEQQLQQLAELEERGYVTRVRDEIIAEHQELKQDEYLLDRLNRAYDHALTLGFTDIKVITQFLYQEAFAPDFYKTPAVHAWLTKPGASVEQRFTDLLAIVRRKAEAQTETQTAPQGKE